MKPTNSLHKTIISEYEKRLKISKQTVNDIELELSKITDAKVISDLNVAVSDEKIKQQEIKEKLNSLRDYINDSSVKIKVK
jgi:predicted  nucleic acid-binding Zn-ribbon protein